MHGYQKKVVYVRNPESRIFDEAYFVLREGSDPCVSSRDMVEEATRIIERECSAGKADERRRLGRLLAPVVAFFFGTAATAAVFLWLL